MEFTLLAAALTGVLGAWVAIRVLQRAGRLQDVDRPTDVLIGAAAVGVFAGRILEMITAGVNPITNPFDVLLVRGGVDPVAASVAALALVSWTFRGEPGVPDQLAPAALAGLAGWHAGCVWTGACLGTATNSAFGFTLPGSEVLRHPTEIYTAALLIVGAIGVSRLSGRFRGVGAATAIAGAARLLTEPMRPSITGGPVWWYAAAVVVGGLIAVFGTPSRRDGHRHTPTGAALDGD